MEYEGLTERTKDLLQQQEGLEVDFKEKPAAVEDTDLVAFANSERGGVLLVGVREERDADGRQVPTVVGCPFGDIEKQKIVSKAASCVPQIDIEIIMENTGTSKPIIRIEIPSGKLKPYCTGSGRYDIRDDGQTKPLLPPQLLNMFLSAERDAFVERYRIATSEDVNYRITELNEGVDDIGATVGELKVSMDRLLKHFGLGGTE